MIGVENGSNGTSKNEAVLGFFILFLIQFAFAFNDIIQNWQTSSDVSLIIIVKAVSSSLVITLIFYGYNKRTMPKPTPTSVG